MLSNKVLKKTVWKRPWPVHSHLDDKNRHIEIRGIIGFFMIPLKRAPAPPPSVVEEALIATGTRRVKTIFQRFHVKMVIFMRIPQLTPSPKHGRSRWFIDFFVTDQPQERPVGGGGFIVME
jgi:hypothetical protein